MYTPADTKTAYRQRHPNIKADDICPECDEIGNIINGVCYICVCGCDLCEGLEGPVNPPSSMAEGNDQMHLHEKFEEKGIDEPAHPDLEVRSRMAECTVSDCPNGCKYYHDSKTDLVVLQHNVSYGCRRTKADILANPLPVQAVKVHETVNNEVWVDSVAPEQAQ